MTTSESSPNDLRDGDEQRDVEVRRTLPPTLRAFREEGYRIVGVEQATNSQNLQAFEFHRRTVLVIGPGYFGTNAHPAG